MTLYTDFICLLWAVNPIIVPLLFLLWTSNLSRSERIMFANKSIFAALIVSILVMLIFWEIVKTTDIIVPAFRIAGAIILIYISVKLIVKAPKHVHSIWIFFACPIVTGPATATAVFNSVIVNGILQTLLLLVIVMVIVWTELILITIMSSRFNIELIDKLYRKAYLRAIFYAPVLILAYKLVLPSIAETTNVLLTIGGMSEMREKLYDTEKNESIKVAVVKDTDGFNLLRMITFSKEVNKYPYYDIHITREFPEKLICANAKKIFDLIELEAVQGSTLMLSVRKNSGRSVETLEGVADHLLNMLEVERIVVPNTYKYRPRDSLD